MKKLHSFLIIVLFIVSCSNPDKQNNKPVARVLEKYLYLSDIKKIVSDQVTPADSAVIVGNYIDHWLKKQLILQKAELNLTDEQKNVDKQIEDYRSSLIIYKYKQKFIEQKLDTVITDKIIEEYYDSYASEFKLNNNIIIPLYIKILKTTPDIFKLRKWYKSEENDDIKQLEEYCYQYAKKFVFLEDNWISFSDLLKEVPIKINNHEQYLKYNKFIEAQDTLYYYFINIKDYKLKNEVSPLSIIENKIISIILNKRKLQLIQYLEKNMYQDALGNNDFEVY